MSFCLLPNHFHLLVQQQKEGGISKFFHRLGQGYAQYFNKCYERSGRLFQSEFQAVMVKRDAHFMHLPRYIHLNVLDTTGLSWRDGKITDWRAAFYYLEAYPWSSHHIYMGRRPLLPVVEEPLVKEMFPNPAEYQVFLKDWIGSRVSVATF